MLNIKPRELDRFNASFTKQENGCWICSRPNSGIYSRITIGGVGIMGHVFALMLKLGRPLRPGYKACHSCNTPRCVNPDHLREDTQANNVKQMVDEGRHGALCGDANPCTILKTSDILFIRESLEAKTETISSLAHKHHVTFQAIYQVATGMTRQEVAGPLLGKRNRRKLTVDEVVWLRERAAAGIKQISLAKTLGIHQATVCNIIKGSKRRDVPFLLPV